MSLTATLGSSCFCTARHVWLAPDADRIMRNAGPVYRWKDQIAKPAGAAWYGRGRLITAVRSSDKEPHETQRSVQLMRAKHMVNLGTVAARRLQPWTPLSKGWPAVREDDRPGLAPVLPGAGHAASASLETAILSRP